MVSWVREVGGASYGEGVPDEEARQIQSQPGVQEEEEGGGEGGRGHQAEGEGNNQGEGEGEEGGDPNWGASSAGVEVGVAFLDVQALVLR